MRKKQPATAAALRIELPLPSRTLHPNARPHWRALARAKKKAREDGNIAAVAALAKADMDSPMWRRATVQATFYFQVRRVRDQDGLISSLKAYADGIAAAWVVFNDSGLVWLPVEIVVGVPQGQQRVVLDISPLESPSEEG